MREIPLTEQLVFDSCVLEFFEDRTHLNDNIFQFTYQENENNTGFEYWSPNLHIVPACLGIWLASYGISNQVRHLFIGNTVADILCFVQLSQQWIRISGNVAFAAIGLRPSISQISFLIKSFPNAKIHTLFDSDLIGRITDCKISLWCTGKNATFNVVDELVEVGYRNHRYHLPHQTFSLNRFEKITGLRSGIRTHKPKFGFGSYFRFLMSSQ